MRGSSSKKNKRATYNEYLKNRIELNKLIQKYARLKMQERKADTHQKILLGGLVVKAGLRDVDSNIILGILIDGFNKIQGKDSEYARTYFKNLGDDAFQHNLPQSDFIT